MLLIKAFHIIAMVAWFAGLFYLPRLFVYHADTQDETSLTRFKIMERRLYYGITWPAAVVTTFLGLWLLSYNLSYYMSAGWMHAKLSLIVVLWIYHLLCGHYLKAFAQNKNQKNSRFFRIYNELPTLLLIGIVILVVVKP
ncbi:protoporphyrinogen oxidase HemJ [Fluoribacter gormanii]|uniref:Protoporphyrinogen IX oxidase n=1 Tax=Fluoribacter gormanii TaxID=464 RepID=A0A377GIV6_9GAMM|nr:protoporphyrinogen oxidase HemJ [Fluoribacter gormanii]KTD00301.1 transmembrane protein [Fluoribacter gormanii]MCW8443766.1 protoporphyrinogen oxidase HemJ [Fluoribacter gormanii]MCW8472194.1 protoporphyrinogen oxidase HemJ [Fluoribacter gormanii]SIQ90399.1 putative membrane protein [Fluoribacter gormanii]STO24678.1 Predicted membrane protein [Fluoribacter gormanii]